MKTRAKKNVKVMKDRNKYCNIFRHMQHVGLKIMTTNVDSKRDTSINYRKRKLQKFYLKSKGVAALKHFVLLDQRAMRQF